MPINLHLFSSPGDRDIRNIIDASRVYLESRDEPLVAYLPLASLSEGWQAFTEKAFKGLARVGTLNSETMTFSEMEEIVRRAHVLYVPGGNTFLLAHRLNVSRWMPYLRKKILAGLPLVGFSAGSIMCGPNILTSQDMNMVETPHFAGLNLMPFNLYVHYDDEIETDEWLSDFHVFQPNPVILMADNAYLRIENKKISIVRGDAWVLRKGQEKEKLLFGQEIKL
ncbi:MAG: Type 1 glutamine amidotransferase-like domain-containing protein [Chloroflexi bacterium]|nr:Type 1 glutamine amidotransferase-like domain-containing protein [Chloroflexota bacterium]